jgi:transcriptional regulator with XRE-family HTH domain
MGPTIAIGANIYRHRKESQLTQDDLARHLGVTKASVSKWETGQSFPDVELLPRMAACFDVTVDALVKKSLVESVAANPAFAPLLEEPRFKRIVENLWEVAR